VQRYLNSNIHYPGRGSDGPGLTQLAGFLDTAGFYSPGYQPPAGSGSRGYETAEESASSNGWTTQLQWSLQAEEFDFMGSQKSDP
jgi:hypothetical protein